MERNAPYRSPGRPTVDPTGSVDPDTLYRLDEAKARMGWRDAAFRAAVRVGLRVFRSGKRIYVLGSDLIAFVTKGEVER